MYIFIHIYIYIYIYVYISIHLSIYLSIFFPLHEEHWPEPRMRLAVRGVPKGALRTHSA